MPGSAPPHRRRVRWSARQFRGSGRLRVRVGGTRILACFPRTAARAQEREWRTREPGQKAHPRNADATGQQIDWRGMMVRREERGRRCRVRQAGVDSTDQRVRPRNSGAGHPQFRTGVPCPDRRTAVRWPPILGIRLVLVTSVAAVATACAASRDLFLAPRMAACGPRGPTEFRMKCRGLPDDKVHPAETPGPCNAISRDPLDL